MDSDPLALIVNVPPFELSQRSASQHNLRLEQPFGYEI